MSKHKMVDGRLLQMNKSFGQLKQKQREKIAEWMYQAYKKQVKEGRRGSSESPDGGSAHPGRRKALLKTK